MMFHDRRHAGELLAKSLEKYEHEHPLILALPRGGVPVAFEIATELHAPLDVAVVRKIGAPYQPELAVGAICEDSSPLWNDKMLSGLGLSPGDLAATVEREREKIKRQTEHFRHGRAFPSLEGKTVIIVDDGLATGSTMAAAVEFVKSKSPSKIVIAVPMAAASSARRLRKLVDDFVAVEVSEDLVSVSEWYDDFSQTSDEEVVQLTGASH